ncbi:hypothetical protein LIER_36019 [Lithospermum erythrorhizon]|uniref:Uncharacterized protein n=1 Tax=Lithospermum erythrorhizon TaxID=34254 RepID=A0AAV3NZJ5_LITER
MSFVLFYNCSIYSFTLAVLGAEYDLELVRAEFHDKMYLVLLRRTYNRRSDARKRLLLVAYFDDIVPLETDIGSFHPPTNASPVELTLSKTNNITEGALKISPLKRQLGSVTIKTGPPVKKALFRDTPTPCEDTSCWLETAQDGQPYSNRLLISQ